MDGGPRRAQNRGVINRSGASDKQPETTPPPATTPPRPPVPVTPTPPRSYAQPVSQSGPGFFKKHLWSIVIIILLLLVIAGGLVYSQSRSEATAIDSSKYQAVFFTNGQVYFGKLGNLNSQHMTLTDVYYLQSDQTGDGSNSENPQDTSVNQQSMQLVKLGKEIHGPEDKMVISKDQMLFYENLKADGKVSESITKFNQGE